MRVFSIKPAILIFSRGCKRGLSRYGGQPKVERGSDGLF